MSNTPDNSNLQSRLLLVGEALKNHDIPLALNLLLDVRDTGFVNKDLDQHIQTLNENFRNIASYPLVIPAISEWIDATTDLMRRTGAEDFEQIEHVESDIFDFAADDFISFDVESVASSSSPIEQVNPASSIDIDFDFDFDLEVGANGSDALDFDFDLSFEEPEHAPKQNLNIDQDFTWFDDFENSANLTGSDFNTGGDFDTSSLPNQSKKREQQQTPTNLVAVPNPFKNNANTPTRQHKVDMGLREPSNVLADAASTYSQHGPNPNHDAELDALLFEEELYEQAKSLVFEDSEPIDSKPLYRGEPLLTASTPDSPDLFNTPLPHNSDLQIGHEPTNPFAHDAPTGVRQPSLQDLSDAREISEAKDEAILIQQVRKLYESGKFQSALDIITNVLNNAATPEAELLKQNIERELERQHHDRIGSLSRIPLLAIPMTELSQHQLDHRAGFIISQMDGQLSFEDIIDMSAMSRLETMTVLADLVNRGLISIQM